MTAQSIDQILIWLPCGARAKPSKKKRIKKLKIKKNHRNVKQKNINNKSKTKLKSKT